MESLVRPMPADPPHDVLLGLAEAAGFGALGRAVFYALGGRRPGRLALWLWEIPAAVGLGVMGMALAEHYGLSWWQSGALTAFIAASGVELKNAVIDRIFSGGKK